MAKLRSSLPWTSSSSSSSSSSSVSSLHLLSICSATVLLGLVTAVTAADFKAGAAIVDITGPLVQANTMGYAHARLSGLHTRLFCRAFAFRDSAGNSAAYAVLDLAMVSHLLAFTIGNRLSQRSAGRYSERNTMICATHTHAGPGGYNQDLFLALNTPGFDRRFFDFIVEGVVQAILTAHSRLTPARLLTNSGPLHNASVNRHPEQYLLNPPEERALYTHNVDTDMYLLRIDHAYGGAHIGSIAWFPVHCTSLKVDNEYVSGDNKGVASLLMESHFEPRSLAGRQTGFVAAFPQSNSGDVTPNIWGVFRNFATAANPARCNSSQFQTFECESRGPSWDQYESAAIIGRRQFEAALKLHGAATQQIRNPTVSVIHDVRDVSSEPFPRALPCNPGGSDPDNLEASCSQQLLRACKAAVGYAFCAGTADGKALFSYFTNGAQRSSVLVNFVRDLLAEVSPEDAECQGSKKICLNFGRIQWSGIPFMSSSIPTQILRLGSLFVVSLPTEVSTMAGRRLAKSLSSIEGFPSDGRIQLNSLSNGYYFYLTTEEEYNGNYYEAGATLFGPNTLNFYAWHFGRMLTALVSSDKSTFEPMRTPLNLDKSQELEVVSGGRGSIFDFDFAGLRTFGEQLGHVEEVYKAGQRARFKFVACNPRNSFGIRGHSFVLVELYRSALNEWLVVSTDAGLDTRFLWRQGDFMQSEAIIEWDIPDTQRSGFYRVRYQGHCKPFSLSMEKSGLSQPEQLQSVTGESTRFIVIGRKNWTPGPEVSADDVTVEGSEPYDVHLGTQVIMGHGNSNSAAASAFPNSKCLLLLVLLTCFVVTVVA